VKITRRELLKMGLKGAGAFWILPLIQPKAAGDWTVGQKLGRVCVGKVDVRSGPSFDVKSNKVLYEDAVVPWIKEVIGVPNLNLGKNRRWVETPDGYIYSPHLQPAVYRPNTPLNALPDSTSGKGMWAEVTVPVINVSIANPPARSPLLNHPDFTFRLYPGQVYWIDGIRTVNGSIQYRASEKHGSYGDMFWADATGLKPISADDLAPITPDQTDKKIVINVSKQTLSCFEGKSEVYFCRVSTGAKFDMYGNAVDKWSTPVGINHVVSRKYISIHMAGGSTASGYELFGVSWTSIFATGGVAIHATYWHNNYGEPMSHGCVNVTPEDARWVFRWTRPNVVYDPGKIEQSGYSGTKVVVEETV
jgi:hypothetical protein